MTAMGVTRSGASRTVLSRLAILPNRRLPHVLTALGDSRVAAVYLDGQQRARNVRSPVNWANSLLGHRFEIGETFGKSGDRTDEFLARLPAAIATGAGTLYVQGGVNDLSQVAGGATRTHAVTGEVINAGNVAAMAMRNLAEIATKARAAGMIVVLENEVGADPLTQAAGVAALNDLRRMIFEYGRREPGVFVHDAFGAVMQSTTATPTFRASHAYDGIHENGRGAYFHGKSLARLLATLVPPAQVLSAGMMDVPANGRRQLLTNHLFTTTSGGVTVTGITGNVPGSCAAGLTNATATLSTAANPNGIGNGLQAAIDFSGVGLFRIANALNGASSGAYHAALQAGDVLEATAEIEIVGTPAVLAGVTLDLVAFNGTGGTNTTSVDMSVPTVLTAAEAGPNEACTFTLRTRTVTLPASVGAYPFVQAIVRASSTGAGGATIIVRQLAIWRRVG